MANNQKPLDEILRERISNTNEGPFFRRNTQRKPDDLTDYPETPNVYQKPLDAVLKDQLNMILGPINQTVKRPTKRRQMMPLPYISKKSVSTETDHYDNNDVVELPRRPTSRNRKSKRTYGNSSNNSNNRLESSSLLESQEIVVDNKKCSYWSFLVTTFSIALIVVNDIILLHYTNLIWE